MVADYTEKAAAGYATGYAGDDVAAKRGNIQKELDNLADSITTMEKVTELLFSRISTILMPSPSNPSEAENLKAVTPDRAEFANWLVNQTERVRRISARIGDVESRVDL